MYKLAAKAQLFEVVLGGEQPIEVDPPAIEEGVISNSFLRSLGERNAQVGCVQFEEASFKYLKIGEIIVTKVRIDISDFKWN